MKGKGIELAETLEHIEALVVVRTAPGEARRVAEIASRIWNYPDVPVYLVMGVRWSAAMGGGERVILSMRARNEDDLAGRIAKIKEIEGVINPTPSVVEQYYKDGRVVAAGHDGLP